MATETTLTSAKAWGPDVTVVAPDIAVPDALILKTSTVAATIEGDAPLMRVQYVDDAAAGFIAEGTVIPEANPALSEVLVATGKVAQLIRLSREQWVQPNASELLSVSVRRAVTRAANAAYIAQANPTSPAVTPPGGLFNVAGLVDGGAIATSLDALTDVLATLADNYSMPTDILLSPTAWASLRKFKTGSTYASTLLGAATQDAQPFLLGLPVTVDPAIPAGDGLVLDKRAVVSAVGAVEVAITDQFYFSSDSIGIRATWRFGANVVRPDRCAKFTVTDPDA